MPYDFANSSQVEIITDDPPISSLMMSWDGESPAPQLITLDAILNKAANNASQIANSISISSAADAGAQAYANAATLLTDTLNTLITANTFTPSLAFTGGTTGITYAGGGQLGRYWKIAGGVVYVNMHIILTSKGSSTGAAKITGLPFPSSSVGGLQGVFHFAQYNNLASLTGVPSGSIDNGGVTTIDLFQHGAANTASLASTNFTNTSDFYINGWYRTDA